MEVLSTNPNRFIEVQQINTNLLLNPERHQHYAVLQILL